MQKLFEDMRVQVESFIAQRDRLTMIASVTAREQIALCKILQGLDEGASPHVFCIFTEPFADAEQYVRALVEASRQLHENLQSAAASDGAQLFAQFPEHLFGVRQEPELRLRELLVFVRSLIPNLDEQLLVVAFLPTGVANTESYAGLFTALLSHEFPVPWCHHMRFVVLDDPATPMPAGALTGSRTQRYAPDLSDGAIERSLEAEADDDTAPLKQRMQSLMVLAGMDSAHRRTEQALEKNQLLANYHCELGNLPSLALALNSMGEACSIAQRADEARGHFERALTPAIEAQDLPTLTNISFNLARLHQSLREWPVAVEYYTGLSNLARASLNAALQLICHEQLGICLRELGQEDRALEEWRAGETLSEGAGMLDQRLTFLRRRADLLSARGRASEVRDLEKQMAELRRGGAQELPL